MNHAFEGSFGDFTMVGNRDCSCVVSLPLLHDDMAAGLSYFFETVCLQYPANFACGKDAQPRHGPFPRALLWRL